MARLSRVMPVGIPQHIIQRGNNRQVCFADEADMKAYLGWLKEFALKCNVDVHAWVLMTNHVHLLCTQITGTGTLIIIRGWLKNNRYDPFNSQICR